MKALKCALKVDFDKKIYYNKLTLKRENRYKNGKDREKLDFKGLSLPQN